MRTWFMVVLLWVGEISICRADDDAEIASLKAIVVSLQKRIEALETAQAKEKSVPDKQPVMAGHGTVQVNGLLQNWFVLDAKDKDMLRTRRMEVKLSGLVAPHVKWTTMFDLAKSSSLTVAKDKDGMVKDVSVNQSSRELQDAFLTLDAGPHVQVDVGQYKVPIGMEGLQSSAQLETVERALFTVEGNRLSGLYGDFRDLGVLVTTKMKGADAQAGVFNGESLNNSDKNERKDILCRIVLHPDAVPGLQVGVSRYSGRVGEAEDTRNRTGVELRYDRDRWLMKSEWIRGTDGSIHREGWYALAGYKLCPAFQGVIRYDVWDPDIHVANNGERDLVVGINYFLDKHNAKVQLNYVHKNMDGKASRNQFLSNLQIAF